MTTHETPVVAFDAASVVLPQLAAPASLSLVIGPELTPVKAIEQAAATLDMLLAEMLTADAFQAVRAVAVELVDLAARYAGSEDLTLAVDIDAAYATVTAGEMRCPLPAPDEEPGLYLVQRTATAVMQHRGAGGGFVTWAAVPISRPSAET
ncbi:hypothetical protein ACIQU7_23410 [Streptomyces albidoflavus]